MGVRRSGKGNGGNRINIKKVGSEEMNGKRRGKREGKVR